MMVSKCDHCGNSITDHRTCGVSVVVRPNTAPAFAQGDGHTEKCEFCYECALALAVGLKSRKAQIAKHGVYARM